MLQLSIKDPAILAKICHALSTELRLNIISLLEQKTLSCLELSKQLGYPLSTISANVKILEEAGLIITELLPAKNGSKKLCSLVYLDVLIQLSRGIIIPENTMKYEMEIPIGNYMDFQVAPSCGYIFDRADDSHFDEPNYFLEPERIKAGLLWFRQGYVEYRIPLNYWLQFKPQSISFELELCAEAPGFNNTFKSDITMWINGIDVGTWTCPGDFGDRRGRLTPQFWEEGNTQYGLLTKWKVSDKHTTINGTVVSDLTIDALRLQEKNYVTMRIGVKSDAANIGGVNLFGKCFGDHPQDIKMRVRYFDHMK